MRDKDRVHKVVCHGVNAAPRREKERAVSEQVSPPRKAKGRQLLLKHSSDSGAATRTRLAVGVHRRRRDRHNFGTSKTRRAARNVGCSGRAYYNSPGMSLKECRPLKGVPKLGRTNLVRDSELKSVVCCRQDIGNEWILQPVENNQTCVVEMLQSRQKVAVAQ